VVIYTRQSVCAPIRAEEGLTGILCPPNSSTSFSDLPANQQIGGYPTPAQLSQSAVDPTTIDSEGRCVILEFPAFVLLGVYSPANRDESRDDFRLGFLSLLDARIRNLTAIGKRVILAGDLNVSREELDTANAESTMRKAGLNPQQYVSTPSRRIFNQLLEGGKVIGEKDKGREEPVLWDVCRGFHPGRIGMFTCWEQKINARPGNCGSRIDYVLSSLVMKNWFSDSNIQEGLMVFNAL
jgi:AP endonuclease-2